MSTEGEYVPSPWDWVRNQVEAYERSGGREANMLGNSDWPVVIVTSRGRRTGTVRKFPLMRVEHDGEYALIGSLGARRRTPCGSTTCARIPTTSRCKTGRNPSR